MLHFSFTSSFFFLTKMNETFCVVKVDFFCIFAPSPLLFCIFWSDWMATAFGENRRFHKFWLTWHCILKVLWYLLRLQHNPCKLFLFWAEPNMIFNSSHFAGLAAWQQKEEPLFNNLPHINQLLRSCPQMYFLYFEKRPLDDKTLEHIMYFYTFWHLCVFVDKLIDS